MKTILSQELITFCCKYGRYVISDEEFETDIGSGNVTEEIIGIGSLPYSMAVENAGLGGMTKIQINSDHGIENIYPR